MAPFFYIASIASGSVIQTANGLSNHLRPDPKVHEWLAGLQHFVLFHFLTPSVAPSMMDPALEATAHTDSQQQLSMHCVEIINDRKIREKNLW